MSKHALLHSRRTFAKMGCLITSGLATSPILFGQDKKEEPVREFKRPPALAPDQIKQLVGSSHSNLKEVSRLLEEEPRLVNGTWDWGGGDFETALGAASHMGRKDIAKLLIDSGARKDLFYYAMEGNLPLLRVAVGEDSGIVDNPGPHGLSLIYHAAISGNVDLTSYLQSLGGKVDNGTLNAAVQYSGSYEMTEWVLDNGASYHGQTGFGKKPLADQARAKGQGAIADLLDSRKSAAP